MSVTFFNHFVLTLMCYQQIPPNQTCVNIDNKYTNIAKVPAVVIARLAPVFNTSYHYWRPSPSPMTGQSADVMTFLKTLFNLNNPKPYLWHWKYTLLWHRQKTCTGCASLYVLKYHVQDSIINFHIPNHTYICICYLCTDSASAKC